MIDKILEEKQIVLCTVTKIAGTIVFVKIGTDMEGTITFSEISPGRIRNIRDYVFPGKKIICKILEVRPRGVSLSLRRVKLKEKNEFNEKLRLEKMYKAVFKTVLGSDLEAIITKIKDSEDLNELMEDSKEDIGKLTKYLPKEKAEKIIQIIKEKKTKEKVVGKKFQLSSKASNGMTLVKNTIKEAKGDIEAEISYVSAGNYTIKIKSPEMKKADQDITTIFEKIEALSKKNNCLFAEGDYLRN